MTNLINPHRLVVREPAEFIAAIQKDFGLEISNVEKIEQGYSSQVYKVLLDDKTVFIKINENPQIFPVEVLGYDILKELGIPVPSVIAFQDHPPTLGYSTIILSGAEGVPLSTANLTQAEESLIYVEIGSILKKIHSIKLEGFGRLIAEGRGLRGKQNSWNEFWMQLEKRYQDDMVTIKEQGFLTEQELEVLDEALNKVSSLHIKQGSLLHRDVHRGHIFVTGDKVTGLIDLGALECGDPRYDIAMSMVFQTPSQQEHFKKGYGALAEDPLVTKYLLCIAAMKIAFRFRQEKREGVEEAVAAFRLAMPLGRL
jgi:fructosamine-3-kinase